VSFGKKVQPRSANDFLEINKLDPMNESTDDTLSPVEWKESLERLRHQSQLAPTDNKFHAGNRDDGKHYWLTPPDLYAALDAEFHFDFDPCPYPRPDGFDGLTCEWGRSNYANIPFGSTIHQGKKKGPTAWVRKAIMEWQKGKRVVLVYPVDKWVLMLLKAILGEHGQVRNLGDVRWCATEDGSQGKGTGRHIACFVLEPKQEQHAHQFKRQYLGCGEWVRSCPCGAIEEDNDAGLPVK
jgi:hypothetical protein